ncbi:MAG: tRNA (adenosine(37)-N6)-threonylcarbamoyltransferase complex transferase subunit TsaD [Pirellulaceae bacterium]|nr:tRNA (adenosine(37)-N6)-threonylcarbamoyltransferase complex transferase subunit TsaD [Pirellulaceae bacterium]
MHILTIETTCDETAAAIVTENLEVISSVVASQADIHKRFSGVVPEIAARAHVERILPVLDETLKKTDISLSQIDAIAVANTPGLAGSLLVGLSAAKSLALAIGKPLIAINHLHAHIYACKIAAKAEIFPCVGFIVSGGHTNLYHCHSATQFEYLGGTIDDAAGEAFDKVAHMLGLAYPGGPEISKAAMTGNPQAFSFPRPYIHDRSTLNFSFSGLKTAVRYQLVGTGKQSFQDLKLSPEKRADVAASFQEAVLDCLVEKAFLALEKSSLSTLCLGGGVAANREFRRRLTERAEAGKVTLHIAPPELCTDNAVMGAIAFEHLRTQDFSPLDLDILPGLVRS